MDRGIDFYSNGEAMARLDDEAVTAIPAVVLMHPNTENMVLAGSNGSGKSYVWM